MADPKALIEARVREYISAFNARDIDRVMDCYDSVAVASLGPGSFYGSGAEIRQAVLESFGADFHAVFEAIEIMVAGDVALAVVQGTIRGKLPDGTPLELKSRRSIDVLRRQSDGGWRVAIDDGPGVDLFHNEADPKSESAGIGGPDVC